MTPSQEIVISWIVASVLMVATYYRQRGKDRRISKNECLRIGKEIERAQHQIRRRGLYLDRYDLDRRNLSEALRPQPEVDLSVVDQIL